MATVDQGRVIETGLRQQEEWRQFVDRVVFPGHVPISWEVAERITSESFEQYSCIQTRNRTRQKETVDLFEKVGILDGALDVDREIKQRYWGGWVLDEFSLGYKEVVLGYGDEALLEAVQSLEAPESRELVISKLESLYAELDEGMYKEWKKLGLGLMSETEVGKLVGLWLHDMKNVLRYWEDVQGVAQGRLAELRDLFCENLLMLEGLVSGADTRWPVDVRKVLAGDVRRQAQKSLLHWQLHSVADGEEVVMGLMDQRKLRSMWRNIVINAMSNNRDMAKVDEERLEFYTWAGVELAVDDTGEQKVMTRWVVADNGKGFDPVMLEEVDGMQRALIAGATTGGTGLGLAMVRDVVENELGGRVRLMNAPKDRFPDIGAVHVFEVPLGSV